MALLVATKDEAKDGKDNKDNKDNKENKDNKDNKEAPDKAAKDNKDNKDNKENKDNKDNKEAPDKAAKDNKDNKDNKENKEDKDSKDHNPKEFRAEKQRLPIEPSPPFAPPTDAFTAQAAVISPVPVRHFISDALRPELSAAHLANEPDFAGRDVAELADELRPPAEVPARA
jgi:hypothetical protein